MFTDTFTASFSHKINDRLRPDSFRDNGNRKTGWVSANDPPFWKQRVSGAMLRVWPPTFKSVTTWFFARQVWTWVAKHEHRYSTCFAAMLQDKLYVFGCPFFSTFSPSHPGSSRMLQNEAKCTTFLVKMSFICMRMQIKINHFHIKGWALNLALLQRREGSRKKHNACVPRCSGIKGT